MSRLLRFALISIVPFVLWGCGLAQSAGFDADAGPFRGPIEREDVEPTADPPDLGVAERLRISFPDAASMSGHILNRVVHSDMSAWPEMKHLGEPVILDGSEVTVSDYRIVAGGPIPIAYLPETGELFDAPDGGRLWNRRGSPAVVIPPGASLLMARIDVEPSHYRNDGCLNPSTGEVSNLRDEYLLLAYPLVGETTAFRTLFPGEVDYGEFNQPQSGCFGNGWYYFFLASLDPDPSRTWLAYSDPSDPELQGFWTLSTGP